MTAYDPNNIFAKILRGEFPCYKVYENEHVLAFLDIMPRCARPYAGDPESPCPQHPRHHAGGFRPCRARRPQDRRAPR